MIVGGLFGRVGNVKYVEVDVDGVAEPVDMMRFELSQSPVDSHVVEVSNGHFDVQNPALATLAFCGGKPSDLEAAEGSMLPLAFDSRERVAESADSRSEYADDHGHLMPANVVTQGRKILEQASWIPSDDAVETADD